MNYLIIVIIIILLVYLIKRNDVVEKFTEYIGQGAQSKVGFSKDGSVKKHHRSDKGFECEKKYFKMLKGEPHIPQLIRIKEKKKTIYVTYAGKPLKHENCPPNIEHQLLEIVGIMKKHKIKNTDFRVGNLTVKDGVVYLVDWGMVRDIEEGDEIITSRRLNTMIENLKSPPRKKSGKKRGKVPNRLR